MVNIYDTFVYDDPKYQKKVMEDKLIEKFILFQEATLTDSVRIKRSTAFTDRIAILSNSYIYFFKFHESIPTLIEFCQRQI